MYVHLNLDYLRNFFWKIINYNQYVMFVIPVMLN